MPEHSFFLLEVVKAVETAIENCGRFCPICLKPHKLEFRRPMVCDDSLCQYQFVQMGLGANVESEILNNPETVDLLVCVCYACANNPRHFEPFPKEVYIEKGKDERISFTDASSVASALELLPSMTDLQQLVRKNTLRKVSLSLDQPRKYFYDLLFLATIILHIVITFYRILKLFIPCSTSCCVGSSMPIAPISNTFAIPIAWSGVSLRSISGSFKPAILRESINSTNTRKRYP